MREKRNSEEEEITLNEGPINTFMAKFIKKHCQTFKRGAALCGDINRGDKDNCS